MDGSVPGRGAVDPPGPVLVTGGAGYIGRPLVAALAASGRDVVDLDLKATMGLDGGPVHHVRGDVRDLPDVLAGAPATIDAVVHLAGLAGGGAPDAAALRSVNVEGTRAVAAHAAAIGARRLVVVSSIAALGPTELPADEAAPRRPDSDYGRSKAAAEDAARVAAEAGVEVVVVRPGYVFGPHHRGNFGRMVRALRRGRFVLPGREDTLKAGIYLPDLVGLLTHVVAMDRPPALVHAVYPDTPTVLAWARLVARHVGADAGAVRVVPDPLARVGIAVLGAAAPLAGGGRLAEAVEAAGKLRRSANVVSSVLPLPGHAFTHDWWTSLEDLFGVGGRDAHDR